MKKLLLLFLLVAGGVSTAFAGTHYGFVKGSMDSWASQHWMTVLNDNEMYIKLDGSYIHSGALDIKACIEGKGWIRPASEDRALPTDGGSLNDYWYDANGVDEGSPKFTIAKNANAESIYIYVKTNDNDNWWAITALVVEKSISASVTFKNTGSWGTVKAHTYYNDMPINNAWPGATVSSDNGVYKTTLEVPVGTKVIFHNGSGTESTAATIVNNGIYNTGGLSGVAATITSVGCATFYSECDLDFTGKAVTANIITDATKATGLLTLASKAKVPANTGLYLEGEAGTYEIPIFTGDEGDLESTFGNMLVGVLKSKKIYQIDGDNTNYILTVNKADGTTASTPKFFKVFDDGDGDLYEEEQDGNTVPGGKAYLQIPTAMAAHEFFWFDDDMTGIEKVNVDTKALNGAYYNLAGQRVAQPTKGLYIVNGKKVVVK